jgi:hypothetical protein
VGNLASWSRELTAHCLLLISAIATAAAAAAAAAAQLNRDLAGWHDSKRPQVVLEAADKPFDFKWPQPDKVRAGGSLLQLREVSYTYPQAAVPVLHVSRAFGVNYCLPDAVRTRSSYTYRAAAQPSAPVLHCYTHSVSRASGVTWALRLLLARCCTSLYPGAGGRPTYEWSNCC